MQHRDALALSEPPDLLRRFVPTPQKASYRVGLALVLVQTNDFTLLPALPLGADFDPPKQQILKWKLIRDTDTQGLLESPRFLVTKTLSIVEMGRPCLLGLDRERRELFGFIGVEVNSRTYQDFLVPVLTQMTNEVFSALSASGSAVRKREFVHD
ncbi:MAG TPA: hypothetical protein VMH89_05630 [Candidatus Acidoferrum sp.]|nr:hypothetical protein [Candidatus Acidoferrum sp.]